MPQTSFILVEHLVVLIFRGFGEVARLEKPLVAMNLKWTLMRTYKWLQEARHARFLLKLLHGFFVVVAAWSDRFIGALAQVVIDAVRFKTIVL